MIQIIDSDEDSKAEEEPMKDLVKQDYWSKQHYMHCKPLLLPDHVHVAYLLYPYPKVIAHAKNPPNHDPKDCSACEWLIRKLMMPIDVVDRDERENLEAKLIDSFILPMSGTKSTAWVKQRLHYDAGSHLRLIMELVVWSITGRQ